MTEPEYELITKDTDKIRSYVFTINNWTEDDWNALTQLPQDIQTKYLVYGKEIGKEGTPHLQGYVTFNSAISLKSFSKHLKRAWIARAKATAQKNRVYCTKQNDFIEYGEIPSQGKRTDIETVRELIGEGKGMYDIAQVATNYQTLKMTEVLLKYMEKPRNFAPYVKWYWGPTGTFKSTLAEQEYADKRVYPCMDTAKWFDGYDAHEVVIIDDMRSDFIKYQNLLKLIGRGPYRVENKGGSRQMLAKVMIITSPFHPRDLFAHEIKEDITQLLRRIDVIEEFPRREIRKEEYPKQEFEKNRERYFFEKSEVPPPMKI